MSFYGILVLIHILGAICGIGAQFAQPFILKNPKTVKQAEFAHHVNHGVDKLVVIGTFTLLIIRFNYGHIEYSSIYTRMVYYFTDSVHHDIACCGCNCP